MSNPKWKKLKDMDFSELEKRCLVSLMSGVPVEAMLDKSPTGRITTVPEYLKPKLPDNIG